VYRHVGAKDKLLEIVIQEETRRAIAELDKTLAGHRDPADAIGAGFAFLISHVRGHPLFDRLLHREPEMLLPALTINAGPALATYRALIATRLRQWEQRGAIDPPDCDRAAEVIARVAVSLLLTPSDVADPTDAEAVAVFARETLTPMLRPTNDASGLGTG
jgi:AcrR family transcriptional regulator